MSNKFIVECEKWNIARKKKEKKATNLVYKDTESIRSHRYHSQIVTSNNVLLPSLERVTERGTTGHRYVPKTLNNALPPTPIRVAVSSYTKLITVLMQELLNS